MWNVEINKSIK